MTKKQRQANRDKAREERLRAARKDGFGFMSDKARESCILSAKWLKVAL